MKAANAAKRQIILDKVLRFDGQFMTRREYVLHAIRNGATVGQTSEGRAIIFPSGVFMTEKEIGTTALDYAEACNPSLLHAVSAVLHELEHGEASEGDIKGIAWCSRALREGGAK